MSVAPTIHNNAFTSQPEPSLSPQAQLTPVESWTNLDALFPSNTDSPPLPYVENANGNNQVHNQTQIRTPNDNNHSSFKKMNRSQSKKKKIASRRSNTTIADDNIKLKSRNSPISCKIVAFNRNEVGRPRYTISVRFETQEWRIYRYYTDFRQLRDKVEGSVLLEHAKGLPRKHPLRLKLRMKMSFSKRAAQRTEMAFVMFRMNQLNEWLNNLLVSAGPEGLDNVKFLDDWFEAYPEEEPYMQNMARTSHANVETSLYHRLKSVGCIDRNVYEQLWKVGHNVETISLLTSKDWLQFGVSNILSREMYRILFKPPAASLIITPHDLVQPTPKPDVGCGVDVGGVMTKQRAATLSHGCGVDVGGGMAKQRAATLNHDATSPCASSASKPPPYTSSDINASDIRHSFTTTTTTTRASAPPIEILSIPKMDAQSLTPPNSLPTNPPTPTVPISSSSATTSFRSTPRQLQL